MRMEELQVPVVATAPERRAHACLGCMFKTRTCGATGPVDSPFVIVGESPGKNEVNKGIPFIGESGDLLKGILHKAGLLHSGVQPYVTNAIKCWPVGPKKDQNVLKAACSACRSNLITEIARHPRQVILALGAGALWSLTGDFKLKVTQERGNVYGSPLASHGIVASVHPAFLLRGGGSMSKFRQDVSLAVEILHGIERPKYVESREVILKRPDQLAKLHRGLVNRIERQGLEYIELATDIETTGFRALENRVLCTSAAWANNVSYIIPEGMHPCPELKAFMEEPKFRFIWHNGKFDIQFFHRMDIKARVDEDTMLLSYALDENKGLHDLEQVSNDAVGAPNWKAMLEEYLPNRNTSYEVIPKPVLHKYAGKDASATLQSFWVLKRRVMADRHLIKAYTKVLIPASNFLAQVENNGMLVDLERNTANEVRLTEQLKGIQGKLDAITLERFGKTVNINSPIQVGTLLYEDMDVEKIKGSTSTGKDVLTSLPRNGVIDLILEYRKASKALGTYVKNLPSHWKVKPRKWVIGHIQIDGRVRCVYLLHGTVTGRLSSRKPNLQNIPRDPLLRSQFRAAIGNILFEVDLNQAELRCLAELSGDPDLMAIYLDPDHPGLHHEVSVTLFGKDYTDENKMMAKTVNFGIVYGRTGGSIAEAFDLSAAEGDRWVNGWFKRFPVAAEFIRSCREAPLLGKLLVTPFGRKRRFGVVTRQNKNGIQNEASNFLHQSIASDVTLVANAKAIRDAEYNSRPINVVHDSGLHETLDDDANVDRQVRIVKTYMEAEAKLWGLTKVPFIADAKIGTHWGELRKYKLKPDNHFAT